MRQTLSLVRSGRRLAGLGVILVAMAAYPAAAMAGTVTVQGTLGCCSTDWTTYSTTHSSGAAGDLNLAITDFVQSGRSLSVRAAWAKCKTGTLTGGTSSGNSWTLSEIGTKKAIATNVLAGTCFRLQARVSIGLGLFDDRTWGGDLYSVAY